MLIRQDCIYKTILKRKSNHTKNLRYAIAFVHATIRNDNQ